jgi:trans-aconitate methyltransferase
VYSEIDQGWVFTMLRRLALLFLCLAALHANPGISHVVEYQKNSNLQWEWATDSLEKFSFNSHDKILDVGSGDGKITALIAASVPQGTVVGLDISEKMVCYASSLHQKENLVFIQGDAINVPFNEQFDKIVSFCTLHWIVNQEQALQSIRNSLKPQGILLAVVPGKSAHNLGPNAEKLIRSEKWAPYFPHFEKTRVYFSSEEYADLLKKVRFEVKSIKAEESVTVFHDRTAFIQWLTPLVNFTSHLPPSFQELFLKDLSEQMLSHMTVLPDGSILMKDIKLEIVGVKNGNHF